MRAKWTIVLSLFLWDVVPAEAGSVAFRLGRFSPRGGSELWQENIETFDLTTGDFNSIFGGVEVAIELSEFVDLAFGVDGYRRSVWTHYRDFVRDDGTEIEQRLRLTVVPVTAGLRFLPFGKFHVVVPYVAGGFGLYPYEYKEEGEFIDFATYDIFGAVFWDSGVGVGTYGAAGVEAAVSRSVLIFGEFRHHWVWAEHGDDFWDFGDFDLDANEVAFGVTLRF